MSTECTCPGGASDCLHDGCACCRIVDFAEELPPCADDDDREEWHD